MPWLILAFVICGGTSVSAALRTELVASGFSQPIFVTAPPGDDSRLFVVEQYTGLIRIIELPGGTVRATPFLDVEGIAVTGEQGLLGLAFHPNYAANGFFFVYYTDTGGDIDLARYTVSADPQVANPTKTIILEFEHPEANHNGGWIGFGTDGFLYIASGDGGGGNDLHGTDADGVNGNGQTEGRCWGRFSGSM